MGLERQEREGQTPKVWEETPREWFKKKKILSLLEDILSPDIFIIHTLYKAFKPDSEFSDRTCLIYPSMHDMWSAFCWWTWLLTQGEGLLSDITKRNSRIWVGLHQITFEVPSNPAAVAAKSLQSCPTVRPHRRQPTRLPRPWDSPGKNTGVGCHFLLQCTKVKSESEVAYYQLF